MNKRFSPAQEYDRMNRVPKRDPWHMEGEDGKNLCGSQSKSQTCFVSSITCPKCKEIMERRSKSENFFYRENNEKLRTTCSFCGAVHRNPIFQVNEEAEGKTVILSFCDHCRKFFLSRLLDFFGLGDFFK